MTAATPVFNTVPNRARLFDRGMALMVDMLILSLVLHPIWSFLPPQISLSQRWLLLAPIAFFYFAVQDSSKAQATFGKRFFGLKTISINGNPEKPIDLCRSCSRAILKILLLTPFGLAFIDIVLFITYLLFWLSENGISFLNMPYFTYRVFFAMFTFFSLFYLFFEKMFYDVLLGTEVIDVILPPGAKRRGFRQKPGKS